MLQRNVASPLVLLTIIAGVSIAPRVCKGDLLPVLSAREIIEKVTLAYDAVQTIQGRFVRDSIVGDETQRVIGTFIFKKPDRVIIHNLEPREQDVTSNGQMLWLYDKKDHLASRLTIPPGNEAIKDQVGIGALFAFNPFFQMGHGYSCRRIDDFDKHIVIACKPNSRSASISRVLVKVNPARWTVAAYEIFDISGGLISQTKYEDMQPIQGASWFPFRVETKLQGNGKRFSEIVRYSRITINGLVDDKQFEFSTPKGVRVLDKNNSINQVTK